jgi:hypothetical protein
MEDKVLRELQSQEGHREKGTGRRKGTKKEGGP